MEPNPPQPSVDPYAPPKSVLEDNANTTYLEEDGYAFQNELVANHHFKSPLICAKLGISIPPEPNPQPKNITITRTSRFPKNISHLISIILSLAFVLCLFISHLTPIVITFIALNFILQRLTSKPYQIPVYLSEQYTYIRKRRILAFSAIGLILATILIIGIITKNSGHYVFSILASIITLIAYKFNMTYFVVTKTKGEFHYIRGIHQGLLNALPNLPLSSTPSESPSPANPMFFGPIPLQHTTEKQSTPQHKQPKT